MRRTSPGIFLVVLATSLAFALIQLDVTIVNVALPTLARQLSASLSALQWVVDAYAIVFAVLLLTAGVIGDRFGAKRVFLTGLVVFALGSAGGGTAPGVEFLVGARAVQGNRCRLAAAQLSHPVEPRVWP